MNHRALKLLFSAVLLTMVSVTFYASTRQSILAWTGLTRGVDRYWTLATLCDAYAGFLTFYVWVLYKETRAWKRIVWFIAIMLLGNIAMSAYLLRQLARLAPGEPLSTLLSARHA
jgi:hypothetical protein